MDKKFTISIILILTFAIFLFYWIEIRTSMIRENCMNNSITEDIAINEYEGDALSQQENRDYKVCLIEHGLKVEQGYE